MRGAFCFARRQPLYRCFISMDDVLGQHGFAQYIYQRLQLYAGLADPQSQRRTRNCQASTAMLIGSLCRIALEFALYSSLQRNDSMITCHVRYVIDPYQLPAFEAYSRH